MIRITTNGALRNYKSSLMRSTNNLDSARNKVLTQRNFTTYAEDPAAATQAFKLRRAFSRVSDQLDTNSIQIKRFESAWTSIGTIKKDLADAMGRIPALEGGSDTVGSGRQPLGQVFQAGAEAIVQTINGSKYGDSYIFAGSNTANAPYSWGKNGELLYHGINVDTTDPKELEQLKAMSEEKLYVDMGAGLKEDSDGNLIEATAFDSAISGLGILGYGLDKDGDPKNVASLMTKLGDIYSRCDAQSGAFASEQDKIDAERIGNKMNDAVADLTNKWTELDGKATYLNTNQERLKDSASALNQQFLEIEDCNLADAITEFSWAQYCYNSALKVGNSILSQSLIDYMN